MVTEFQIKQNYGDSCCAWIYFTAEEGKSIDELKKVAQLEMQKDWGKACSQPLFFGPPPSPYPTIEVAEYAEGKKVRGGIRFKTKWR